MTSKRDRAKPKKPQTKERLESVITGQKLVNQRKEKMADFLIDVAKYVLLE